MNSANLPHFPATERTTVYAANIKTGSVGEKLSPSVLAGRAVYSIELNPPKRIAVLKAPDSF